MPQAGTAWRTLATLGEKLLTLPTLYQQYREVHETLKRLFGGEITLWLDPDLFHLPDSAPPDFLAPTPDDPLLKQAIHTRRTLLQQQTCIALPLEHQNLLLGGICIRRQQPFSDEDQEILQVIASIVALGFLTAHRFAVERWRLEQLQLVRKVALQIAHVLDVDELADRVTALIQQTFGYYYVAIFTLEEKTGSLAFRSNAAHMHTIASPITQVPLGVGLIGLAAQTGEEIHVPDVSREPRYRAIDGLPETRSEAVFPLKTEQGVIGVLDVQSDQPNAFHPNDLLVLQALSDSIARAIHTARLYTDLRRRAEQMEVVSHIGKRLTASLKLDELMKDAAELLHTRFGYSYVHLFTVHPNRRQIIYRAGSGARSQAVRDSYVIPLDQPFGIIPWVARSGETALLNDVNQDARYHPSPLPPPDTASELCVPLIFDGQVVGILDIQSDQPNAFDENDRQLAEAIGDTLAVAIRNADLYRSEQWRRQVAESLREVAILLSEDASLDQVLKAILEELQRTLPTEAAAIWLMDEEDNFYVAAAWGVERGALQAAQNDSPTAAAWLLGALLNDAPNIRSPQNAIGPLGLAAGFPPEYSAIATPLKLGDEPLGILALAHSAPGRYGHEASALLETFAGYAAVAIENARLYDHTQQQAYASAALLHVAQVVAALTSLEDILQNITRSLPILLGVERVLLYEWAAEQNCYIPLQSYGLRENERQVLLRPFVPEAFPLLAATADNRLRLYTLEPGQVPETWLHIQPPDPVNNETLLDSGRKDPLLMAIPLSIKNEHFGVMLVEETDNPLRFRRRRVEILTSIAQQISMAIQNDRLQSEMVVRERLQTEVALARRIQQDFIPNRLPVIPGLQAAGIWLTARQVGGDFYDILPLPDGSFLFTIADVADKGMPAALFMALTRKLVHATALQTLSPAQILTRINQLVYPDCKNGMFVTAVCARYEPKTGEMTWANAGHNPPLLVTQEGSVTRWMRTGMALGVLADATWDEQRTRLQAGDTLCLYTDGVTETFAPDGRMWGEAGLLQLLLGATEEPPDATLERIRQQVLTHTQSDELQDDLTLIILRKEGL